MVKGPMKRREFGIETIMKRKVLGGQQHFVTHIEGNVSAVRIYSTLHA
jgi:hypothetical protein